MDRPHDPPLVWRTRSPGRDPRADGGLVFDRLPAGADSLSTRPAPGDPVAATAPKRCCAPTATPRPCRSVPGSSVARLLGQLEETFHEVQAYLGVETRAPVDGVGHLADQPCAAGSLLLGGHAGTRRTVPLLSYDPLSVWYAKSAPTFADALALVHHRVWTHTTFCASPTIGDLVKMPRALVVHLAGLLCSAACMGRKEFDFA